MRSIYVITNQVNGKQYVGQTGLLIEKRLNQHSRCSLIYHPSDIASAIKKYGCENFDINLLEECPTQAGADCAEEAWIQRLNTLSPCGYNLRHGGERGKLMQTAREKIAKKATGRKRSEEAKRKVAEKLRGRKRPDSVRQKISRTLKGREFTPEWQAKLSEAGRRAWSDPEHRARMLAAIIPPPHRLYTEEEKRAVCGVGNPNAKLTWEKVRAIRRRYETEGVSQEQLATEYGVKQTAISRIVRNVSWIEG